MQICNTYTQNMHEGDSDMPNPPSATVRARRLRRELRRHRETAGLSIAQAAKALDWHGSKISRIENGQSRAATGDVADMLDAYGVKDEKTRKALIQLAREARRRGWWTAFGDVHDVTFLGLEAEAAGVKTYEAQFVPGLLQTEEYARALIESAQISPNPDEVERRVEARMRRQEVLTRPAPPQIWAIIDEPVIMRPVGGSRVMRDQLLSLVEVTTRPNSSITVQVLPLKLGAHIGMSGPFTALAFADPLDPPVVYLEAAPQGLFLEEPEDIERYTMRFDHLRARALGPEESRDKITDAANQLA